ncbi:phosphatase PAP2 family protein [Rhizobium halophytocola]|uniref:Inositolphosphotransferase Aur1/Ipt1 domain-containing protein n=1 Tax=Rhizobium halophytocola TaxID=735519 RepID=A0ABS4E6B5_9HYPH|nr:phosphatase PAP2 family protein [Rhizobium halophytocola]MBP1853488.1 hypothetical protein [Rhizobium halophytocola]
MNIDSLVGDRLAKNDRTHSRAILSAVRNPLFLIFLSYIFAAVFFYKDTFVNFAALNLRFFLFTLPVGGVALGAIGIVHKPASPLSHAKILFRQYGLRAVAALGLLVLGLSAFSTFKVHIPETVTFYADGYLASIDRAVFGMQAWRAAHSIFPDAWAGFMDVVYSRIWFVVVIGSFAAMAFASEGTRFVRYLAAMVFVYAGLGSVGALAGSSVGPIFYDAIYGGERFEGLTRALTANPDIVFVKEYAELLLGAYEHGALRFATGISAMPSIHVAMAVLIAWLLTSFGRRWAVLGWAYAAFILFGSVYTGWHYACDGVVSLVSVSLFWLWVSRYLGLPLARPRRSRTSTCRRLGPFRSVAWGLAGNSRNRARPRAACVRRRGGP